MRPYSMHNIKNIFTLLLCLTSMFALAQTKYQVSGKVIDSVDHIKLSSTSVSILNAKDSTLIKFSWTDLEGSYQLNNLKAGKYILLLSYPDYADYVQSFTLDSVNANLNLGTIKLTSKVRLLNEVIIQGKVTAIKIKGDTTEFNARAYVIQPNAKVEDLLKQLPGIQIDNNGKITANGQVVRKVLVEGEEFFGDDPTLVTKNLRGDMIDKIQVYDKKSDQASFTGIDDGLKEKTINLKLKEDKKRGYFGKIDLGIATEDFYQSQGMLNIFKEKQKMAVYGNLSNTGKTGLSSSDNNKYGTASGTIEFIQGGITTSGVSADEIESNSGRYNGQGIPESKTAGTHYDRKWNNDNETINTNYKIGSLAIRGEKNTITQNDLPNGLLLSNLTQNFSNYNFRQRLDGTYQLKMAHNSTLKFAIDGASRNKESENIYLGNVLNQNDELLNTTNRTLSNKGDQQSMNASALYTKKFKKEGRTMSWNITTVINRENTTGYLNAINNFYDSNGDLASTALIDQYKISHHTLNALNNNLTFSESLSKTLAVVFNYRLGLINNKITRKSFNQSGNGFYELPDPEFSNSYLLDQFSNQAGAIFSYRKDKKSINFGTRATKVDFKQLDLYTNQTYTRIFLNWNPQINYRIQSPQKLFVLGYSGNTQQPAIEQIQPIKDNTDPLNIVIGNQNLKPAFRHNLNSSYNVFKAISGTFINLIASYDLTANPIINSINTNDSGQSTFEFTNLENKTIDNLVLRGDFNKKIKKLEANVGLSFVYNSARNYGISNNHINKRTNETLNSTLSFNKFKAKKYDYYLSVSPKIIRGRSSLQDQLNNNGHGLNGYAAVNLYVGEKFEIHLDANYDYQSKTQSFSQGYSAMTINSSIARKFLKDKSLKLSISGNDILNQNLGFNRSSFGTMVTQDSYNTISRYFMCSLTWDFSKFAKALNP